jgi:hypothetical protein
MSDQRQTTKIRWRSAKQEKPADGELCHIRGEDEFMSLNIPYKAQVNAWFDFFASPEAGAMYSAENGVLAWVPASELDADLPDEIE